ncbi:MAG TPA: DUF3849 domain-containing protein [Candidatus Faecousia intestinigallinarum]|nr:DUF3849 domain-containing protein [Candidatus Faecousia intestinigallinarum]
MYNDKSIRQCLTAIDQEIQNHTTPARYGVYFCAAEACDAVLQEFPLEQVLSALAVYIARRGWDLRFTQDNRTWAFQSQNPEVSSGIGMETHAILVDAFTTEARKRAPHES